MKKIFLILFLILSICPVCPAQIVQSARRAIVLGNKKVVPGTLQGEWIISQILSKRLNSSFKQACIAQKQALPNAAVSHYGPSNKPPKLSGINPQALYPHAIFLTTQKQLASYFTAKNNLAAENMYAKLQEAQRQIILNLEDLQAHKITPQHPKEQDTAWLAQQIPSSTNYFFIGETHYYPEIQEAVADLLHKVRSQFPERKILLFTEFLLDGQVLSEHNFDGFGHSALFLDGIDDFSICLE